jgi:DNA-binding NarL/FixJ family response regulator
VSIRVLLVDDQSLLRLGFRMVLEAQPDIEVVGEAGDGAQAVAMTRSLRPDVVLMDVRMPVLDGIQATRQIVAAGSAARILVLTTFNLDEYVFAALRAGASGFLLKDVPPADLLTGIRAVAVGDAVVAPTCPTPAPAARPPTSGCTGSPTGNERCWSRWHAATPTPRSRTC